jgi:hypothetical protein
MYRAVRIAAGCTSSSEKLLQCVLLHERFACLSDPTDTRSHTATSTHMIARTLISNTHARMCARGQHTCATTHTHAQAGSTGQLHVRHSQDEWQERQSGVVHHPRAPVLVRVGHTVLIHGLRCSRKVCPPTPSQNSSHCGSYKHVAARSMQWARTCTTNGPRFAGHAVTTAAMATFSVLAVALLSAAAADSSIAPAATVMPAYDPRVVWSGRATAIPNEVSELEVWSSEFKRA